MSRATGGRCMGRYGLADAAAARGGVAPVAVSASRAWRMSSSVSISVPRRGGSQDCPDGMDGRDMTHPSYLPTLLRQLPHTDFSVRTPRQGVATVEAKGHTLDLTLVAFEPLEFAPTL